MSEKKPSVGSDMDNRKCTEKDNNKTTSKSQIVGWLVGWLNWFYAVVSEAVLTGTNIPRGWGNMETIPHSTPSPPE